ncbi:MAG: D-glycero-beta-D-manno-heptose-7-phosphate kinase [Syntrophobacterales bacterium CG03_land_8_20_14_0_80_58_14]|nr:MAG: D-glycero-beta-D-manno-heptose-7-phosphate kinase [Syntrophobacterales bacterium CG03_land_8_20_14_0_80_58_14]
MDNFPRSRVLVVGDIMADHFIWGKVSRISPEAPVPVVEVTKDNFMLGGSANVQNNILAMGGRVHLTGVVGADETGRRLLTEFRSRGVDTEGIVVETGRPTTLKTRIVAHGQQVVRFDREERKPVQAKSIQKILTYIESLRDDLGALVISDYSKGVVTRPLLDGIRKVIAGRPIFTCVDPKQRDFAVYQGFDIITPNHYEAGHAAGEEMQNGQDHIRVGMKLLQQYDFRALLMTRGEEGMSLFEKDGRIRHTVFPTAAREVFDVTGAGDTVIGVLALSLAAGASFREAAYLANHAAGIVVGKAGTATVTREELRGVL